MAVDTVDICDLSALRTPGAEVDPLEAAKPDPTPSFIVSSQLNFRSEGWLSATTHPVCDSQSGAGCPKFPFQRNEPHACR